MVQTAHLCPGRSRAPATYTSAPRTCGDLDRKGADTMDYWRVLALFLMIPVTRVEACSSSSATLGGDIVEEDSLSQHSATGHHSHEHSMYSQNPLGEQAEDDNTGSIDDFCERGEDEVETGHISPSAKLRLNFAGRFLADVSTFNNLRGNFNISTFDPLREPGWNPKGSADFRLVDCRVTEVCLADGHCGVVNDPIVGQTIIGSDSTSAGKLVDLDTDNQDQSQLWGLVVGVDGFLKGDFVPRSFNHMHDACTGLGCNSIVAFTRLIAVWVSTLQNVKWVDGPLAKQSDFIQQVMALRCMPGFQLHVKLNVYNMRVAPKSEDYLYGRVVGTIFAAVSKHPLPYGLYKRMLWRDDGGHVPFYVDVHTKHVVLDFANSMKFDIEGNPVEPSGGPLYLLQYNGTKRRCEPLNNEAYNLGEIKLSGNLCGNHWFLRTAGIIALSVKHKAIETIGNTPLTVIQQMSPTHCEPVLEERPDGLFVEAVGNRVARKEPNNEWNVKFRAFQFGRSAKGVLVKPKLIWPPDDPKPAIDIVSTKPSGSNGISAITFRSSNPGKPRREEQLDGQVYKYDIIAQKEDDHEFIVRDLMISAQVYSEYNFTPGKVTWYEHVYPIFQQYANLYPVMKPIINLASYEDVTKKLKILKHVLTLPETNPNYMPVTRDLSPTKRRIILSWLDDLDTSTNLPPIGTNTHTLEELKRSLQVALQLELATIPPYLSALFSIKDGENREVASLIRSIVVDEMKHMALVSNLLNAIGGAPNLNHPSIVPSYPNALPGGANPGLVVKLARCSLNQIRTVFQGIERPDCNYKMVNSDVFQYLRTHRKRLIKCSDDAPTGNEDTWTEIDRRCRETTTRPATIGAIYIHQILCPMVVLQIKARSLFTGENTKQITSDHWFGKKDSSPYAVYNLPTAVAAIVDIATEGEGSDPCDPFDEKDELSHYFKFAEVVHGRRLIETDKEDASLGQCFDNFFPCDDDMNCTKTFSFAGRLVPFFDVGVWPTISNPHSERYPLASQVRKYSDNFNKIYTGLLKCIHEAFNGNPYKMKDCMGMMSSLTAWGKKLVRTPVDPDGDPEIGPNAAPTFEFYRPRY
ncbi:uncharacterized protein LOC144859943 [Branchiostoma floridae x Branchiostoma japonicum]